MPTTRRRFLEISRDVSIALSIGGLVTAQTSCSGGSSSNSSSSPSQNPAVATPKRPNIVLFVVDDLGVGDCGICGSAFYRTPSIDRMAREGMRFTQAYSPSPLCSSSRAAIFTGKYPHRLGITGAIVCGTGCTQIDAPALPTKAAGWQKVITPSYLTQLPLGERTIAEYLRDVGYATAHIGKWHLGGGAYSAAAQGFMHVVGGGPEPAPQSHFLPYGLGSVTDGPAGEYIADRLTNESESFIRDYAGGPFFLSLSHYGVHLPLQAPEGLAADYGGRRDAGNAQRNAVYAAMIEKVDQSLGRLLAVLDDLGLSANTLVIVTSDNGGLMQTSPDAFLRRVTSNGPFRGGKAHIYEGGIRVPMLVRWASRIGAGSVSDVPVCGTDILPTVLDVVGLPPANVDGRSFQAQMVSQIPGAERALFWHFPHYTVLRETGLVAIDEQAMASLPATAVRRGDYKLVRVYGEGATTSDAINELYDLAHDPGETRNIAALHPSVVSELGALLVAHLAETGALTPIANPGYLERLGGWLAARHCTAQIAHGYLRLTATGNDPQLLSERLSISEGFVFRVRLRSARRTSIQLFYSAADTRSFDSARSVVTIQPAGSEFTETEFAVTVSAGAPVTWLRLDPGTTGDIVDIDEIRIVAAADTARTLYQWGFNGVTGLPYGGAWFAVADTFVASGPGSLQIELAGSAPAIMSPPVTLFGPLQISMRLRSTGAGPYALAWSQSLLFSALPSKSVNFNVSHDGAWHEYSVAVNESSDEPVQRLVLFLGNATGIAEIDYIQVFDSLGSLVLAWKFGPGQAVG